MLPAAGPTADRNSAVSEAPSAAAPAPAGPVSPPRSEGLSQADITALLARGDEFIGAGDLVSARLFYQLAAEAGDGSAALRLGATFDPGFLGRAGIRATSSDPAKASSWYRRAGELGNPAAGERLKTLERRRFAEPGPAAH